MCQACWEEWGCPKIDTPDVRAAAAAVRVVYRYSPVGGNIHVMLDDWNIEDEFLDQFEKFISDNVHEIPPDGIEAERRCLGLFRALGEVGRASALAMAKGYL